MFRLTLQTAETRKVTFYLALASFTTQYFLRQYSHNTYNSKNIKISFDLQLFLNMYLIKITTTTTTTPVFINIDIYIGRGHREKKQQTITKQGLDAHNKT
jgi:hypothetical protein